MKPANYWKLGLFVLVGLGLAAVAVSYFGTALFLRETVEYKVYFDESVQGLAVGGLVRFRGVSLGQVAGIRVAPDRRHIEVSCALSVRDLHRQGLTTGEGPATRLVESPGLRAQLSIIGLTGEEVVMLDFFDPETHPVARLTFPTPDRTIPATQSELRSLEDSAEAIVARLPALLDAMASLVGEGNALLGHLGDAHLGEQAESTLRRADEVMSQLGRLVEQVRVAAVPDRAAEALTTLGAALGTLNDLLHDVDGERGLVTSARRASDAIGDIARGSNGVGRDLDDTLREARETLAAIRRLANALDRDPDMLLKGRKKRTP
jgi:paraquat-inducible protein B